MSGGQCGEEVEQRWAEKRRTQDIKLKGDIYIKIQGPEIKEVPTCTYMRYINAH